MIHTARSTVTLVDLRAQGILAGYLPGYPASWDAIPGLFDAQYRSVRQRECSQCHQPGALRPWFFHRWIGEELEALILGDCDHCGGTEIVDGGGEG